MNNFLGQVSPYEEEYFTIEGHNFVMSFGHQLNTTFNNKLSIVLDGTVYNYVKLKESYFDRSEYFETNTDAEVVLKLYEKMGVGAFSLLEGTFVFSIYDKEKGKIFLVRDFFGEKQLYYSRQSNEIYWSSELKSIISILPKKPQIDIEGLNLFFQLTVSIR